MIETEYGSIIRKYSGITGILFLSLFIFYALTHNTNGILEFQAISLILCLFSIIIGTKCNKISHILIVILSFQIFSLIGMSFFDPAEDIADKENYEDFVREMLKMNSVEDLLSPITSLEVTGYSDISDMGYSLPLYICVYLFGWDVGLFVMGILKLLCHTISVVFIYKLSCTFIGIKNSMFVALLWGLNINNSFFILAGLKESLFVIAVLYAVYRMYTQIQRPCLKNIFLFLFASFLTILFRAVFPAFFILTYIGYFVIFKIRSKRLKYLIAAITFVLCFVAVLIIFSSSFQTIMYMMEEDEEFTKAPIYLKIINGFVYPYPCIRIDGAKANLLVASYSAIHASFAIFAIMGLFYVIKNKQKQLFPLIGVFSLNTLMLIITGFSMNIRFLYPTHILYYVFIPIGITYYFKRKIYVPYMCFVFLIVVMYNQVFG